MVARIFALAISLFIIAGPAYAVDAPKKYRKCKACHGLPGGGKTKWGPDLFASKMNLEQYKKIIKVGSKFAGRPDKMPGFEKKKMNKVRGLTEEDVEEIFNYIQTPE